MLFQEVTSTHIYEPNPDMPGTQRLVRTATFKEWWEPLRAALPTLKESYGEFFMPTFEWFGPTHPLDDRPESFQFPTHNRIVAFSSEGCESAMLNVQVQWEDDATERWICKTILLGKCFKSKAYLWEMAELLDALINGTNTVERVEYLMERARNAD